MKKLWTKLVRHYLLFRYGCASCQNEEGFIDYRRMCQYHGTLPLKGEIGQLWGVSILEEVEGE